MLKQIRILNFGWILTLVGAIVIISGLSMTSPEAGERTFLCFDKGCIYVQGVTNIVIGLLTIGLGVFSILRK